MTFTANGTGGKYNQSLTVSNLPSHAHTNFTVAGNAVKWGDQRNGSGTLSGVSPSGTKDIVTGSSGGNVAHNNIPPYKGTYFWRRTA